MVSEKASRYNSYLLSKRDKFANHLIRVGSKLLQEGKFNRDAFSKNFLLDKDEIIKKIEETVKYENDAQHDISAIPSIKTAHNRDKKQFSKTCCDSQLIDILRDHIDACAKDLKDIIHISNCCNDENNNESISMLVEHDSSGERNKNLNNKITNIDQMDNDENRNNESYFVTQEIMPGECSKIFVQKSRVDIISSKMNDTDFENDLLETIYVYRR